MSTAPTIRNPLRDATWRTMPAPMGPSPMCSVLIGTITRSLNKRIILTDQLACCLHGSTEADGRRGRWPSLAVSRCRRRWPRSQDAPRLCRRATPATRSQAMLDPATHQILGTGRLPWRNITAAPATRAPLSPLLERLARHEVDVDARAGARPQPPPRRRPADDCGGIDVTDASRSAAQNLRQPRDVHRARRWQRRRPDGAGGAARHSRSRRAKRSRSIWLDRARAADVRAHRAHRQLLLHRAVVSEDRRRSTTPAGTRISFMRRRSSSPTSATTTSR